MKVTHLMMRQRKDGEIPTARIAIRNHCRSCMGYQPSLVEGCTARDCWLFPWRMGTPAEFRKPMSDSAREAAGRRLQSAREAKTGDST